MKKMSKVVTGLAAMAMVVSLVLPAKAVEYQYKFTLSAGKQGTVNGDQSVSLTGAAKVTFAQNSVSSNNPQDGTVTVTDGDGNKTLYEIKTTDATGKYYVKGIKKSGRDEVEPLRSMMTIDKDTDYVVAYGVMKNPVTYTVYYKDANGKDLLDPVTFVASAGDKPVVAYQDIPGYVPNALNETRTLVDNLDNDPKKNVFTFVYYPIPSSPGSVVTNEQTETVTNTLTQIVPGEGAGAGAEGGGTLVVPGEGGGAGAGAGAGGEAAGEEGAGGAEVPEEPRELVDLDDEEVPLANVPGAAGNAAGSEQGSFFVNMPPAVIVGVVSMAVLVVAAAWYFLFMKKKRTNAGNEEK